MSIIEALHMVNESVEDDNTFIIAAIINVCNEKIRRLDGRVLYTPADAKALLDVLTILLDPKTTLPVRPVRTKPSQSESMEILEAAIAREVEAVKQTGGGA